MLYINYLYVLFQTLVKVHIFPIFAAVLHFLHQVTWSIELLIGLGAAFERARFASPRPVRDYIPGDDFE
jgi:hypothetical protein